MNQPATLVAVASASPPPALRGGGERRQRGNVAVAPDAHAVDDIDRGQRPASAHLRDTRTHTDERATFSERVCWCESTRTSAMRSFPIMYVCMNVFVCVCVASSFTVFVSIPG